MAEVAPLDGVTVLEMGDGIGVSVAGLLLGDLGASVVKVADPAGRAEVWPTVDGILDRGKQLVSPAEAPRVAEVLLLGAEVTGVPEGPVTVAFPDKPAAGLDRRRPVESMLAEAESGIMWLQLGHREGPYCLASPVAALGAGVLGAISATCGLLRRSRGVPVPWRSRVTYRDGAMALQTLSASFLAQPSPQSARTRYRDPYCVSFSPLMRFHRASDGWVFIAAVSAHMWHTLFGLIGHPELRDDQELANKLPFNISDQSQGDRLAALVGRFVAGLTVDECVSLMVDNHIVAAPVLSSTQFLAHPQAEANGIVVRLHDERGEVVQAARFLRLVPSPDPRPEQVAPIGDLPTAGDPPLRGIRVLDMSRAAAGPICGRVLADLGATVVRVEHPAGESSRRVGLTFVATNRNKLSLGVDVKSGGGASLLGRLIDGSDVVLTNALPDASVRLGIDWSTVAAKNPSACHVSVLGFGRLPPFGGRRVVDAAAQALSGQALAEGGGSEPVGCTGGLLDNGTGWLAALGAIAALVRRQRASQVAAVEASLLNTSAFIQLLRMADPKPRDGAFLDPDRWGYSVDQRLYRLADGWICVAASDPDQHRAFDAAAGVMGVAPTDRAVHGQTAAALERAVAGMTVAQAADVFSRADFTSWALVQTLEQAARSGRGGFVTVAQEPWGEVLQTPVMPTFDGAEPRAVTGAAPAPGRDNFAALERFGLVAEWKRLVAEGTLHKQPGPVILQASTV